MIVYTYVFCVMLLKLNFNFGVLRLNKHIFLFQRKEGSISETIQFQHSTKFNCQNYCDICPTLCYKYDFSHWVSCVLRHALPSHSWNGTYNTPRWGLKPLSTHRACGTEDVKPKYREVCEHQLANYLVKNNKSTIKISQHLWSPKGNTNRDYEESPL